MLGIGNGSMSSLRIPCGLMVTLYEDDNFGGRQCQLVQDTPHLGSVNDKATSTIIEAVQTSVVIFYTDASYCGWSFVRSAGIPTSRAAPGVKFTTADGRNLEVGLTTASSTAFSTPDALFTDRQTRKLTITNQVVITGMKF